MEIHASTQGEGSISQGMALPQLSTETQMNIWKDIFSLTKKGKIHELGMVGSCAFTFDPLASTEVSIELHEKKKQSKEKLKKMLNWVDKQLDHLLNN